MKVIGVVSVKSKGVIAVLDESAVALVIEPGMAVRRSDDVWWLILAVERMHTGCFGKSSPSHGDVSVLLPHGADVREGDDVEIVR